MLQLEEAVERILALVPNPAPEVVPLRQAAGRVLLETISAELDLPGFDNSSVDGYAVRSVDVAGAARESPLRLALAGRVAAGARLPGQLPPGCCMRLFTGAPLPDGADAVVMQEETRVETGRPDGILFLEPAHPNENVRFQGEDVQRGSKLVESGTVLRAGQVSLLAAQGVVEVRVGRRPVVGVLATGSELRNPGDRLETGQVYESNRAGLAPLIDRCGGIPRLLPLTPDTLEATRQALERALAGADVLITCGGVSVGEMDFVRTAFEQLGGTLQFWRVSMKPGKPFEFGQFNGKPLFGLPGNPVSALVTFLLLVRPALLRWQGAMATTLPCSHGVLVDALENPGSRRHFMSVVIDSDGQVRSTGPQGSHRLTSFASANGLLDVPPRTALAPKTAVRVLRWE